MTEKESHDACSPIESICPAMPLGEIGGIVNATFTAHFGLTTDEDRIQDVGREAREFLRALSRRERKGELGDLLASLLAYCAEQEVDPAAAIQETLRKIARRAAIYAARGDKKKIAIYGGAFDMPQNGHIAVAKAVLNSPCGIDEVWFMPAYEYVGSKRLTDAAHRAAMCRLLETIDPRFRYFDYEIANQLKSETLLTLLRLSQEPFADTHRTHFIVSIETANALSGWPRSDELTRAVPFITTPRPGFEPNLRNPWFLQEPHRYLADAQGLIEVSSTDVRKLYRAGRPYEAEQLVHPQIHAYIMEHGLYQE